MAVAPNRALPAGLARLSGGFRRRNVVRHLVALEDAMQNYPLQRLQEQARGKAIESERVRLLESRAARAVLAEIRELGKIAQSIPEREDRPAVFLQALPLLSRALAFQNGDWSVRQATVGLLGVVWGDSHVVPLLEYIMNDFRAPVVCRAAAVELAAIGGMEAVDVMARALAHDDDVVRQIAIEMLENRHLRRYAVPALERGLRHPDPRVRQRVADVLDKIEWQPKEDEMRGWYAVARQQWDQTVDLGDASVPALESAMKGSISQVRRQAARVLDKLEWDSSPYAVRGWYVVAKQDWDEAVSLRLAAGPPLVNALLDREQPVRDAARQSLTRLGFAAVPALVSALHDAENAALVKAVSGLLSTIVKEFPDQEKEHVPVRFSEAVPWLVAAIRHPHRPIIIEPAFTLADIAENIPDRQEVCSLFDPIMESLVQIAEGEYGMMRHDLDSVRFRIHRARTGTVARPVPKFLTFVWRKGTVRHKTLK